MNLAFLMVAALAAELPPSPQVTFFSPTTVRVVRAPKGSVPKPIPIVVAKPGPVAVVTSEEGVVRLPLGN